jgi:hypothetical protein
MAKDDAPSLLGDRGTDLSARILGRKRAAIRSIAVRLMPGVIGR